MGIELMKAWVNVRGDASAVAGDLTAARSGIESAATGLASRVTGILSMIGVGFGVGELVSQGRQAVAAAEESINAQQRLAAMVRVAGDSLGLTTEELTAYATQMMLATNTEDEAVMGAMSRLMTFKTVTGETFKTVIAMAADLAAAGFGSIETATFMLGRAMEDPTTGMMMMRRMGIIFTAEQKKQIKTYMELGQQMKAQAFMLDVIRAKVGGVSGEMAKSAAGPLKAARIALGELHEVMGAKLIPISTLFVQIQQDFVKVLILVSDYVSRIADALGSNLIKQILEGAAAFIAITAAIKAANFATVVFLALAGPAGWVKLAAGLAIAGAGVYALNKLFDETEKKADKASTAVKKVGQSKPFVFTGSGPKEGSERSEMASEVAGKAWAIEGRKSEVQIDIQEAMSKGLLGDKLRYYISQRLRLARAEADESIRKVIVETAQLREGWSAACVAFQEYLDVNQEATRDQRDQAWGAFLEKSIEDARKPLKDLEMDIRAIENGWDDSEVAFRKFLEQFEGLKNVNVKDFGEFGFISAFEDPRVQRTIQEAKNLFLRQRRGKLLGEGKELEKETQTPFEKYMEQVKHLREMLAAGVKPEVVERGMVKARKELRESIGKDMATGTTTAQDYGKKIQDMLLKAGSEKIAIDQLKTQGQIKDGIDKLNANVKNIKGGGMK